MRHKVHDKKFNRDSNARKALFMALLRNLTERGEITTTRARGKVLKQMADKIVGQAQDNSLLSRRILHKTFGKRDVVNTLVDRVAPAMSDRKSGFVRIVTLGNRRGDNTPMVKVAFVNKPEVAGLKSGKTFVKPAAKKVVAKTATKKIKAKAAPVKKAAAPKVKAKAKK